MRELILGGQKSGKSRLAEERARAWLSQSPSHKAVLIATGLAHDEEMRQRIARHQADRLLRLPELRCVEEPLQLGDVLRATSDVTSLVVIDCMTMWLTNLLMPLDRDVLENTVDPAFIMQKGHVAGIKPAQSAIELIVLMQVALAAARGPVVLVSNEIGLGVIPMGRQVRKFVDELGRLNQALARQCEQVSLMAAGCALKMKG